MDYTIKDMCKKLNLTVHTVRHYCDMGLVPNLRHDKNGNRIFNEGSVELVNADELPFFIFTIQSHLRTEQ